MKPFSLVKEVAAWPDKITDVGFELSNKAPKNTIIVEKNTLVWLTGNGEIVKVLFERVNTENDKRTFDVNGFVVRFKIKKRKAKIEIGIKT